MEEVKNKTKVEELEELLEKISIEMGRTRERQTSIDNMTEELYNETRPMMVEKRKEEIESAKNDKAEFDEMTKNALINAKKFILQIREESEKAYQDKLLETLRRKQDIERKLSSMLVSMAEKRLPSEKLERAKEVASEAMEKVDASMHEFQEKHFELREKLKGYEKTIREYAVELGVEQEIDAVTLEDVKVEYKSEKTPVEGKKEQVKAPRNDGLQTENAKTEVKSGPKVKTTTGPAKTGTSKAKTTTGTTATDTSKAKTSTGPVVTETGTQKGKTESNPVRTETRTTQTPPASKLEWHKDLTPEQIEYAKEKDIYEPVGPEYEQFLRELGIVREQAKVEKTTLDPVKTGTTELKWHKDLTPEQIEYAKEKDIYEPVGPEYEQFLRELGLTLEPLETEKTVPENTEPENTVPENTDTEHTDSENTGNDSQDNRKNNSIVIEPVKNQIEYSFADIESEELLEGQFKGIKYDARTIEQIKGVLENFGPDLDWESVADALDPNIIDLIAKTGGKQANDMLAKYFETLSGKKTDLSIGYDLRNIYDSDLDSKQIKKLMKIAKAATKHSKGAIKVEKDSLIKRLFGNIKKRFSETDKKLLTEQNKKKQPKVKTKVEKPVERISETPEKGKVAAEQPVQIAQKKEPKKKRFVGPKIPRDPEYYREAAASFAERGIRLKGRLLNEDQTIIDEQVKKARAAFVPRATVDEAKAVQAVEEGNASKKPRTVVIEHPDGKKEEGVSLTDD